MGSPASRDGLTYRSLLGEGRCRGCWKEASETRPAQAAVEHDSLAEITLSLNSASASLADIRFLFILLVGYAGVFRISEVLSIRVRDVSIFDDFMKVHLIMRKNDQYRNGDVSVIARSRKPTCLVGITEGILSLLPDSSSSTIMDKSS